MHSKIIIHLILEHRLCRGHFYAMPLTSKQVMESCECVLANNHINHKLFSIYFVFSFQFFLQLLCISLVSLIFLYFAQILFENALFCRQNARLKSLIIAYRLSPSPSPGKRTLACFPLQEPILTPSNRKTYYSHRCISIRCTKAAHT